MAVPVSAGPPLANVLWPNLSVALQVWLEGMSFVSGLDNLQNFEILPGLFDLVTTGRAKPGFTVSDVIDIEVAPAAYRSFNEWKETKVVI